MTLTSVCNTASEVAGACSRPNRPSTKYTTRINKGRVSSATPPPMTLNSTCASAARLALGVAPIAAKAAVEVVPIFAPMTTPAAAVSGMTPPAAAVSVTASAALEDCMATVSKAPALA